VPTLAEAGAAAFDFPIWYGLWAPVGTPARTVRAISKSLARVLTDPALRGRFREHDADVMRMSQTDFAQFVVGESERAARIIEATHSRSKHLGRSTPNQASADMLLKGEQVSKADQQGP
jgi:tripartite-type tricarboxylate transporter receptor subunit TctC